MFEWNLSVLAVCYRILAFLIAFQALLLFAAASGLSNSGVPFVIFPGQIVLQLIRFFKLGGPIFSWLLFFLNVAATCVLFAVASSLKKQARRTFCLLVSWLLTAYFPTGTVLGVFTILQLLKSETKAAKQLENLPKQ